MLNRDYILYVDDDPDDTEILKNDFIKADPSIYVLSISNGEDLIHFLDNLSQHSALPMLIILDLNMPRMTGEQTLQRLKANEVYKNIPVVLFSTASNFPQPDLLRKYKTAFISKPSNGEERRIIIHRLLEYCQQMKPAV